MQQAIAVYTAWQSFAVTAPNELAMAAVLRRASGTVSLTLSGDYYGTMAQFVSVISPLMSRLPNNANLVANPLGWIQGLEADAGNGGTLNTSKPDIVRESHILS